MLGSGRWILLLPDSCQGKKKSLKQREASAGCRSARGGGGEAGQGLLPLLCCRGGGW